MLSFSYRTSFFSSQICIFVANSSRLMRPNCSSFAAFRSRSRTCYNWCRLAIARISSYSIR